jgi:hypothetical protein
LPKKARIQLIRFGFFFRLWPPARGDFKKDDRQVERYSSLIKEEVTEENQQPG